MPGWALPSCWWKIGAVAATWKWSAFHRCRQISSYLQPVSHGLGARQAPQQKFRTQLSPLLVFVTSAQASLLARSPSCLQLIRCFLNFEMIRRLHAGLCQCWEAPTFLNHAAGSFIHLSSCFSYFPRRPFSSFLQELSHLLHLLNPVACLKQ